jgi:hypothetical protein
MRRKATWTDCKPLFVVTCVVARQVRGFPELVKLGCVSQQCTHLEIYISVRRLNKTVEPVNKTGPVGAGSGDPPCGSRLTANTVASMASRVNFSVVEEPASWGSRPIELTPASLGLTIQSWCIWSRFIFGGEIAIVWSVLDSVFTLTIHNACWFLVWMTVTESSPAILFQSLLDDRDERCRRAVSSCEIVLLVLAVFYVWIWISGRSDKRSVSWIAVVCCALTSLEFVGLTFGTCMRASILVRT